MCSPVVPTAAVRRRARFAVPCHQGPEAIRRGQVHAVMSGRAPGFRGGAEPPSQDCIADCGYAYDDGRLYKLGGSRRSVAEAPFSRLCRQTVRTVKGRWQPPRARYANISTINNSGNDSGNDSGIYPQRP